MNIAFRRAVVSDEQMIWQMLQDAIKRRAAEGSLQWQDGYPNLDVLRSDLDKKVGYVMLQGDEIVAYVAIFINDEPAYVDINGKWLSDGDFVVYHRVVVAEAYLGKGLSKQLLGFVEQFALEHRIYSLRVDTNFDNEKMLRSFVSAGYVYCGEVYFRGAARKAFEKLLSH